MIFDHGINELSDFANHLEATRRTDCEAAKAWARSHTWEDVDVGVPLELAYHLLLEYLPVLGPHFRAGTILCIGRDPFWSARTWIAVPDLTEAEYRYLFARAYPTYGERLVRWVENGTVPASRPLPAAGQGVV
jgi:hypothetical protein